MINAIKQFRESDNRSTHTNRAPAYYKQFKSDKTWYRRLNARVLRTKKRLVSINGSIQVDKEEMDVDGKHS